MLSRTNDEREHEFFVDQTDSGFVISWYAHIRLIGDQYRASVSMAENRQPSNEKYDILSAPTGGSHSPGSTALHSLVQEYTPHRHVGL